MAADDRVVAWEQRRQPARRLPGSRELRGWSFAGCPSHDASRTVRVSLRTLRAAHHSGWLRSDRDRPCRGPDVGPGRAGRYLRTGLLGGPAASVSLPLAH